MSYFGKDTTEAPNMGALKLPTQARDTAPARPPTREVLDAGERLGFVSREASRAAAPARRPGRRRIEDQDKISVTGAKRTLDRFKAYCDIMGETSYCTAIERLLDMAEKNGK